MFRILPWLFSVLGFIGIIHSSASFKILLDIPSALVSVVFPMLLMLSIYSISDIKQASKHLFISDNNGLSIEELQRSSQVFASYGVLSLASGIVASMLAIIAILANLVNISTVVSNISVSLLTIFYSLLVVIFISFPASNILSSVAQKLNSDETD